MAAVISNGGGYYSTLAYLSEARRMGITVLGPDLNESDWNYRGAGKTIRMGLQQLQNIRRDRVQAILDERGENGPFTSLDDFLRRVELTPAVGPVLVKSGALDSLAGRPNPDNGPSSLAPPPLRAGTNYAPTTHGCTLEVGADFLSAREGRLHIPFPSVEKLAVRLNRPQLLWLVEAWLNGNSAARNNGKQTSMVFFPRSRAAFTVPPLPDLSPERRWQQEIETLGLVLSVHPLALWEPFLSALPYHPVPASELARHVGERVWVLGWPITRKEVMTKEGQPMEFFSFEDQTAIYETVFFPKAFRRFCQDLEMDRAYLLWGQVESEFGTVSLNVQSVRKLKPASGSISNGPPARLFSHWDQSTPRDASCGRED